LLEDRIIDSVVLDEIKEMCKANLRVIPKFDFVEINELRAMVHKKHMRKPEKIKFN
jgi:hypothetical protein